LSIEKVGVRIVEKFVALTLYCLDNLRVIVSHV
jgi:hypothetical protein